MSVASCRSHDHRIVGACNLSGSRTYKVVSLFSGCGGIDLGFKGGFKYGDKTFRPLPFRIVWANDWDESAVRVYNHNLSANFQAEDIKTLDFGGILDEGYEVDVVTAGFPCQDFSLSGPRNGIESERGKLYMEVRRALDSLSPKLFIAENVPGIEYPPTMLDSIVGALSGHVEPKYRISIHRINCADFGVPQVRQRVVMVGVRSDIVTDFTAPEPIRRAPPADNGSVDIPAWMRKFFKVEARDKEPLPRWMNVREAIDDLWSPLGTSESAIADQDKLTHATIVLGKKKRRDRQLRADLPSPTIRAQHHGHVEVHYNRQLDGSLRRLTIRECARIQGFPDSFEFPTSATQAYVQIGNAMPPVVVYHWAKSIASWLSKLELPACEDSGVSGVAC